MRTSATIHQHKHPTNDLGTMWKGHKLDAGGMQVGRSADAKQTQRDAVWTQEGRRRKHQLLSSTHNIYCIWLFRSIKEIHISFLVTLLYFSRNNTLHKMEKSNKDS